jgi:hypothetical protein
LGGIHFTVELNQRDGSIEGPNVGWEWLSEAIAKHLKHDDFERQ